MESPNPPTNSYTCMCSAPSQGISLYPKRQVKWTAVRMLFAAWFDHLEEKYLLFFHWHAKLRQNELVTLTLIVFIYFTFLIIKSVVSTFSGRKPHSKIKQTAKRNSYLTPAGTTNVLRFEVAQSDHVRLKSLSSCFLKEWVRFDSWVVTRSSTIGKGILIGKTIYVNPNLHC